MKTQRFSVLLAICIMACSCFFPVAYAQSNKKDITVYQYRKVAPDKLEEFFKRETTYWSEVAKKSMEKGNLQFWALLEKVGGNNDEPNILFINTYRDMDDAGSVWASASTVFPKIPIAQMETGSMSKTVVTYFMKETEWVQKDKTTTNDQKYVVIVYHKASNPGQLIALEQKHWAPFIRAIMNNGQTSQVAWGNAALLGPFESNLKFNTVSYDLYSSLKEALNPTWDPKIVVPEGLTEIEKLEGPFGRYSEVYRVVKIVMPATNSTASN